MSVNFVFWILQICTNICYNCLPSSLPQSNKVSQEIIKQWGHHGSGIAEAPRGEYGDYKATNLLSSPKPLISETELKSLTNSTHTDKDFTAEYAIVKKVLRKSHSLPESQLSELAGHSLEVRNYAEVDNILVALHNIQIMGVLLLTVY